MYFSGYASTFTSTQLLLIGHFKDTLSTAAHLQNVASNDISFSRT
jgi:phage head maturation protease